jgi:hexaprenyl-diphosphate synthase
MFRGYVCTTSWFELSEKLMWMQAREIVSNSTGLEQTRVLAQEYVDKAIEAISGFPDSDAKEGLVEMCTKVMKRRK